MFCLNGENQDDIALVSLTIVIGLKQRFARKLPPEIMSISAAGATAEALRALGGSAAAYARHESLVLRTALGRHEPAAYLKVR